jgi:serine phosphatase RsbU (regulator of sigma subunit)
MLINFIEKIKRIGIDDSTDIEEIPYIRFINIFIVIAALAVVLYVPYMLLFLPETISILIIGALQFIFYAVALLFNYFRRYFLARNILCFNALIFTTIESSVSNYYCDVHLFLLIGVIFVFFVFPEKERKYSYFISICFAVTYIAIEMYLAIGSEPDLPAYYIMNLKHIIRSAFLFLVFFFAYYSYITIKGFQAELITDNSRMESEIGLARSIQQQIIPSKDPADNIFSLYKSMSQLGGDFYDFIFFRDLKKLGIFISDVSGHGVPAALITTMIKTAIFQSGSIKENPSELLMYLNDILIQQSDGNFITAFYGVYDTNNRTMVFSNAGHNSPFLIDSTGVKEIAGGKSIPLAIINNESLFDCKKSYFNSEIRLDKNSKLLLYTDGLVETRSVKNSKLLFENSGMYELFENYSSLPCKQFVNSVYRDLVIFNGSDNFEDDICMICVDIE